MSSKKLLLLNREQIRQKINRIAYQILEDNLDEEELVIAGIFEKGYTIAKHIKENLEHISTLQVTLIRIDIQRESPDLRASTPIDLSEIYHKAVIIVDDVLNTGRTMAYSLGLFLHVPMKKLRTVVLIDRNHRIFPISPTFTGLQLATVSQEYVEVILNKENEEEAVYLN